MYEAEGNPENSIRHVILWVPESLASLPSFPHFSEPTYVCFMFYHAEFLVVLSGRNREKYVRSVFPDTEVPAVAP